MAKQARFYLIRPKEGTPAFITMKFSYKSARVEVSTEEAVLPEHWDKEKQRVANKWVNKFPDYLEVNRVLDDLNSFIIYTYNDYRRKVRLMELTPKVFKGMIVEKLTGISPQEELEENVLEYYRRYIFDRANDGSIGQQTVKNERSAFRKFESFSKTFPGVVLFRHMNLRFFKQYRDWMWKENSNADSTVYKHLNQLRKMLLFASANGFTMGCDVGSIKLATQLKVSKRPMDTIALSEVDIAKLYKLEFPPDSPYKKIRDLFLLGCYTGLRYNRWSEINRENITKVDGTEVLQLWTAKGRKRSVVIPLHPILRRVCESYKWNLPRVPSDQIINRYIKEVAEMAGFTEVEELARNIKGKSEILSFKRYELISTHTARRSFASNAFAAGVPEDDIQAILGHGSRQMVRHYIKEGEKVRAKRISEMSWFTDENEI